MARPWADKMMKCGLSPDGAGLNQKLAALVRNSDPTPRPPACEELQDFMGCSSKRAARLRNLLGDPPLQQVAPNATAAADVSAGFWPGPAASTAAVMVAGLDQNVLLALATDFTATTCIDTGDAIAALPVWPGAGAYYAYDTLRVLRAVMGLRLRREYEAARSMSRNVSMWTHLISLREVLAMVRLRCRGHVCGVHADDAALNWCDTKKA